MTPWRSTNRAMDRQLEVQAKQYDVAMKKMEKQLEVPQTMQQMWDKVTRPRIEMDEVWADGHDRSRR